MKRTLSAFRRTIAIGAVWAVVMVGFAVVSPSASGQESVSPGRGQAYAQGYRVDPRAGGLSFGITYGLALAGHQGAVATGDARSVDLGVIGTTLAGETCDGGDPTLPKEDQPQPVVVRSTDENSEEGRTEEEYGVRKTARASSKPLAEAIAVTAAAGDPAAVQIGSTASNTTSGIVDGARVARAVTEVSEISFAAGQVVLRGLRWEAVWQSAPEEKATGSFTIEGVEVAGEEVPVEGADGVATLGEVNPVLEPLGVFIEPPQVRQESGIAFVDPLRIGIEPSETRQTLTGPVLEGAEPARSALVEALLEADCSFGSLVTVADVVLGSVSGAGSLAIELGGVTARSADIEGTSLLGGLSAPAPATPAGGQLPDTSSGGSTGSPGAAGTTGSSTGSIGSDDSTSSEVVTTTEPTGEETAIGETERIAGTRGGPLVWIGLAGLALLAALAELDRRRMRRAQRAVPMELSS